MSAKEWASTLAVSIVMVLAFFVVVWWVSTADREDTRKAEFAGACKVLEGSVHGDLCIKDDTVVLDREEFDSE